MYHYRRATFLSLLLAGCLACAVPAAAANNDDATTTWPEKTVVLENLEPLTQYQFRGRGLVVKGKVTGPAIIRAHVDATGAVARAVLHTSCGNADLDEIALRGMRGMRDMRFKPYMEQGTALPVTLVVPVHVPARYGRSF